MALRGCLIGHYGPMTDHVEVPPEILNRLRAMCLALPDAYEEQAWVGTRWCVRKKNFAHVLAIDSEWPPAYARAFQATGPMTVLTFRSSGPELDSLTNAGHPFFRPVWAPNIIGIVLEDSPDWAEISELVTESYRLLAPTALADRVHQPPAP